MIEERTFGLRSDFQRSVFKRIDERSHQRVKANRGRVELAVKSRLQFLKGNLLLEGDPQQVLGVVFLPDEVVQQPINVFLLLLRSVCQHLLKRNRQCSFVNLV